MKLTGKTWVGLVSNRRYHSSSMLPMTTESIMWSQPVLLALCSHLKDSQASKEVLDYRQPKEGVLRLSQTIIMKDLE